MENQYIDISVPVKNKMVHWPGDPPVLIHKVSSIEKGDGANLSLLEMSSHTGTHMDAPHHFINDGAGIDTMPLEATIGPARVIAVEDPKRVTAGVLDRHDIQAGERVLLKTRNSERCWNTGDFVSDFVYIPAETAGYLAEKKIMTLGVDYLSVGGYQKDGRETHRILLGAGIWVIEGLNLQGIEEGAYHLICLPLKIVNGDGAPARAVLYTG